METILSKRLGEVSRAHSMKYSLTKLWKWCCRGSLRDIGTCLRAHSAKLYHLGIRGGVKHVINPAHGGTHTVHVTHIANEKLDLAMLIALARVVLFLFVLREHPDFRYFGYQESLQYRIAESARATGEEYYFVFEHIVS